ncbi:hypothetical protein BCR43DRAFT_523261 [Syncephalastrum racemosum]|uniref:PH domain-containing protein n=1 Tax=Syncephalastrum racemosum TaxID=13706 RepID=A0A1X2HJR3_SYNRA|nr:hypothetical protein BCR43DRAFT_523261 [Syncephalastrum racemosum]
MYTDTGPILRAKSTHSDVPKDAPVPDWSPSLRSTPDSSILLRTPSPPQTVIPFLHRKDEKTTHVESRLEEKEQALLSPTVASCGRLQLVETHHSATTLPTIRELPASPSESTPDLATQWPSAPFPYNNRLKAPSLSFISNRTVSTCAPPAIPLCRISTFPEASSSTDAGVLKKGRLLCSKQLSWYSRRSSEMDMTRNHLRLRQSRFRWREFKVILKSDRIELYHVSTLIFQAKRLAHVIYLHESRKHHRTAVHLTFATQLDYTLSIAFRSANGRNVRFLFTARSEKDTQDWYMALYHCLPNQSKRKIPPTIDCTLPTLDNLRIRIPVADDQNNSILTKEQNIRMEDIKRCILAMLDYQNVRPMGWFPERVSLHWRNSHDRLECVADDAYLICPQLIEQSHTLELHPHAHSPATAVLPPVSEGFLTWWSLNLRKPNKLQKHVVYALTDGHCLFLVNPYRALPIESEQNPDSGKQRWTLGRISRASLFHPHHHSHVHRPRVSTGGGITLRSATRFFFRDARDHTRELADVERQNANLGAAFAVVDMTQATEVQSAKEMKDRKTFFEIKTKDGSRILLEAPTVQAMFEWIMRLRKMMQGTTLVTGLKERLTILQSGIVYVRKGYTFEQRFCVLLRGHGLMLFDSRKKRRPSSWTGSYVHYLTVPLDEKTYVYSDDQPGSSTHLPPRLFSDGTTNERNAECSFAVWRADQRHVLVSLREKLSVLKLGHRLGSKGTIWVFMARTRAEKEAWVWAAHHEIDRSLS